MRVFHTPHYYADVGDGHIFLIRKFDLVRDRLLGEDTLHPQDLIEPEPASVEDVRLIPTEHYVSRLWAGTLRNSELRRLGLPWSESLVLTSFSGLGGRIGAVYSALRKSGSSF